MVDGVLSFPFFQWLWESNQESSPLDEQILAPSPSSSKLSFSSWKKTPFSWATSYWLWITTKWEDFFTTGSRTMHILMRQHCRPHWRYKNTQGPESKNNTNKSSWYKFILNHHQLHTGLILKNIQLEDPGWSKTSYPWNLHKKIFMGNFHELQVFPTVEEYLRRSSPCTSSLSLLQSKVPASLHNCRGPHLVVLCL